jgi:prephenate dehydratase
LAVEESSFSFYSDNETRFIVVSIDPQSEIPTIRTLSHRSIIFIRIAPYESRLDQALSILMSSIASQGLSIRRIDCRPKASGRLWEDVYFVELVRKENETAALEDMWRGVPTALARHMEVTTLGLW